MNVETRKINQDDCLEYVAVEVGVAGFGTHQTHLFHSATLKSEYSSGLADFHGAEGMLPLTNTLIRQHLPSDTYKN